MSNEQIPNNKSGDNLNPLISDSETTSNLEGEQAARKAGIKTLEAILAQRAENLSAESKKVFEDVMASNDPEKIKELLEHYKAEDEKRFGDERREAEAKARAEAEAKTRAAAEAAAENEAETVDKRTETIDKAKQKKGFKKFITAAAIAVGAAAVIIGSTFGASFAAKKDNKVEEEQVTTPPRIEQTVELSQYSGELASGVKYDYTEYADYDNKETPESFGYDKSEHFGNREASLEDIMDMAGKSPEILASYAHSLLFENEKEALGIGGMSSKELDEYLSNADNADGGAKQEQILAKIRAILEDKDNTEFNFYYENGYEDTDYILFWDENKDGKMTPDEMHLRISSKQRNGAPQLDILRRVDVGGGSTMAKMLDLNMRCGLQVNYKPGEAPKDIERIPGDQTPTPTPDSTPTPDPTPTPGTPTETVKPKDAENLQRIDNNINEQIAEEIGTEKVVITPTEKVTPAEITEAPSVEDYQGTGPTIVENTQAASAEDASGQVSQQNDYSENQGPANQGYTPVAENAEGQEEADRNELSNEEVPSTDQEVDDYLNSIGIQ